MLSRGNVDITLTSTLTAEDENIIAPAILRAVTNILDHLPIAYRVRIDTVDCQSANEMGSGPYSTDRRLRMDSFDRRRPHCLSLDSILPDVGRSFRAGARPGCPTPLFELRRGLAEALRAKAESPALQLPLLQFRRARLADNDRRAVAQEQPIAAAARRPHFPQM